MASRQWFQARGYCQSRHYLWICHQPAWCLAWPPWGLSWGPLDICMCCRGLVQTELLHSTALTTPQCWWRERKSPDLISRHDYFQMLWEWRQDTVSVYMGLKSKRARNAQKWAPCICLMSFWDKSLQQHRGIGVFYNFIIQCQWKQDKKREKYPQQRSLRIILMEIKWCVFSAKQQRHLGKRPTADSDVKINTGCLNL